MTNKEFPPVAYMNGHLGEHVVNGVYQLKEPFRVNKAEWLYDEDYAGYAVSVVNISEDHKYADIVYFTDRSYNELSALIRKLSGGYRIWFNVNISDDMLPLGGGIIL